MSEKTPNNNFEHRPVSYEQACEAASALYAEGVKDPFGGEYESPALQSAWDTIQKWAMEKNLHLAGGYTAEKATNRVLYETMLITAGYTEPDVLRAIRDDLQAELAMAVNEGSEDGAKILAEALDNLQTKLEAIDPRERISAMIAEKFEEAEGLIGAGKLISAVGTLYATLVDKRFTDHISDEQRGRYVRLMNETKRQAGLPVDEAFGGFPRNWKKK